MHRLEPAHVNNNPKDIRLPHEQRRDAQHDSPQVIPHSRRSLPNPAEMIPVRNKHHQRGHNIGVVQSGEEKDDRERGNVHPGMERVGRDTLAGRLPLPLGSARLDQVPALRRDESG